jgi:hypothetical protein
MAVAAACTRGDPPVHYGYIARLGDDTISIENVTRTGNHLTVDGVDRFPRVRRRHTEVDLGPDGGIRHLVMDIRTPSEPQDRANRHVEATVSANSVHITKRDASDTVQRDFAVHDTIVVAHVPQMYSLYDLYFAAARKHVRNPHGDDTVRMRQFYIDREFDRFSMHNATVRLLPNNKAEIWHDWLAGIGDATLDSTGHLLRYSGARTTYKMDVARIDAPADVEAIGARFAAAEAASGGAKQLSVRDTVKAQIGGATFTIDYGRPLARGRVLLGNIIPYDRVWRTGANAATQFTTSAPITLAGLAVPAGTYTLWTLPRSNGTVGLIVNKQSGQWGTEYDGSYDLGKADMKSETLAPPAEEFTMSIVPDGAKRGALRMAWGPFQWTAPIVIARR